MPRRRPKKPKIVGTVLIDEDRVRDRMATICEGVQLAPRFVPCTLKQLPAEMALRAARAAAEINPVNAPLALQLSDPQMIAAYTQKYWGPGGVNLGVAFLEPTPVSVVNRILAHMNAWAAPAAGILANVRFRQASSALAEVRISRAPGTGYASYLGVDILQIPKNEPTMWLESFSDATSEAEYKRVVRHETGHTLGFPHEHLRRGLIARLDREKTYAYFWRTQRWSRQEVDNNVLRAIDEKALLTPTPEDEQSVMCYALPGEITLDGRPIVGGVDIDPGDARYAAAIYPSVSAPPPPPPPPPSGGSNKVWVDVDVAAGTFAFNYRGRQCSGRFNEDVGKTIGGTWS